MSRNTIKAKKTARNLLGILMCLLMATSLITFAAASESETAPDLFIGDASQEDHDFRIIGMVEKPGYFSIEGLNEYSRGLLFTRDYNWLNSTGSRDVDTFSGFFIYELLEFVIKPTFAAAGIIVTASDGFERSFSLNDSAGGAYWNDIDGNKMMLALSGTASRTNRDIIDYELPRLIIGQKNDDDVNRSNWVTDVVEIRVTAFGDLRGFSWAVPAIEALAVAGVADGMGNNLFEPAGNLTRAMFVTLLGRALNPEAEAPSTEDRRFDDVKYDSWYGMHVEWAVEQEIVLGYEDGTFRPGANMTMAHMLLMAERAGLMEIPESIDTNAQRWATRAEAAVIIYELMQEKN